MDCLTQWKDAPYVKAMCFDTPAVNTAQTLTTSELEELLEIIDEGYWSSQPLPAQPTIELRAPQTAIIRSCLQLL
ncbi:hypothetical protein EVAR_91920_1 [Eumeta japonica]|uniref:Uncharacterized protein n=1 Tax=Eumeta variegata TaxID=151549 RepID=A0A4C1TUA6_EUMVA|nr:hypothetical protein EVAR_91920_1 [Eumeta japonica]